MLLAFFTLDMSVIYERIVLERHLHRIETSRFDRCPVSLAGQRGAFGSAHGPKSLERLDGDLHGVMPFYFRLLKNAHLRRYPARSPSRGRAKSCSLPVATAPLILRRCDVPQSTPPADSLTRRRGKSRSLFVATPLSGLPA